MTPYFTCPACRIILNGQGLAPGSTVTCPQCGQAIIVPWPAMTYIQPAPPTSRPSDWQAMGDGPITRGVERREPPESDAGRICSILSCLFGAMGLVTCPMVFSLAGLVLGVIGACLANRKSLAVIGIVLSVIGPFVGAFIALAVLIPMQP